MTVMTPSFFMGYRGNAYIDILWKLRFYFAAVSLAFQFLKSQGLFLITPSANGINIEIIANTS